MTTPSPPSTTHGETVLTTGDQQQQKKDFRFWAIIFGMGITSLLAALENTVVTTAAPAILMDLQLRQDFVWITNSFFLLSATFLPLIGQLCNIFGRRWIYLSMIAIFTLGSGICGGATTGGMLIAGRAVQAVGSGGITMMNNVIVSDLVPLRQRGKYVAIVLAIFCIGTSLGPFIGGAIVYNTTWRWVFWINLPIGGVSLLIMFSFLHLKYEKKETSLKEKMKRIDFIGNALLIASTVAILYSLTYAGTVYAWTSWHKLVPLLLGFLGFVIFAAFELSGFAREPVMPPRLFHHRTSVVVLVDTFLNSVMYYWFLFFLPVYFQAVALYSSSRAGYSLLPQSLAGIPGAAISAIALSIWGKFKPIHFTGFAFTTLGMGLLSLLSETTTIAERAVFQIIGALGIGIIIDTLLPAFQAPVSESELAAATATWSFVRAFGSIWGVAIPAAVFSNRAGQLVHTIISDPTARQLLGGGGAYQQASAAFIKSLPLGTQNEVRAVYRESLKRVFLVGREVPLRKELETRYGLQEKVQRGQGEESRKPAIGDIA
ncbi:major facilitator superfamily domain-containing protein [Xylariaceae sp. FL0594]|nr:major facilitator superfamily domain-containing protein [Xylariaceae sp. FL0594]